MSDSSAHSSGGLLTSVRLASIEECFARRARFPATGRPLSGGRLVLAEDVAHRAADLAHRAGVLQRLPDREEQVLVPATRGSQLLEPPLGQSLMAATLERLPALDLLALRLRVDAQDLLDLDVLLD